MPPLPEDRLTAQMAFLVEADALKTVLRDNYLQDLSRRENSAEHSWHAALFALVLDPPGLTNAQRARAIQMLILHDLVEIDAGDHPIHLNHDADQIARAEALAAERLFALLPPDQGAALKALWQEFEAGQTPCAQMAKRLDHCQPILQALTPDDPLPDQLAVVRGNLAHGRARHLPETWPQMYAHITALLQGVAPPDGRLAQQIAFLHEADRLKSAARATTLCDASRRETSGEHSWHLALYALVLAEHAPRSVQIDRVIAMLLIHDLVEVDAGDTPIFGDHDTAAIELAEQAAAARIFGLLPEVQGAALLALWQEFEANQTPDARFAKSLDRFQPPNQNLASGGGSWTEYNVSFDTVAQRVGEKINHGAPALWAWLRPQISAFFESKAQK